MPSPDNRPASEAASCRTPTGEPLFKTITSADWKRSLDLARRQPNAISEQIRTAISSSSRKTK
ncbi:MAG: hypothetical protein ABSF76_16085 [Opitutaceae bacterium]